jgi:hypothetical protein
VGVVLSACCSFLSLSHMIVVLIPPPPPPHTHAHTCIIRYNDSNNGIGPYNINCNGASGRYVYVFLPGTNRILNFAELEIWGMYVALDLNCV